MQIPGGSPPELRALAHWPFLQRSSPQRLLPPLPLLPCENSPNGAGEGTRPLPGCRGVVGWLHLPPWPLVSICEMGITVPPPKGRDDPVRSHVGRLTVLS